VIVAPRLEGTEPEDHFHGRRIGVDRLAFGVEGHDDLEALLDSLASAGVRAAGIESDPVLGKEFVRFRDPDYVQWEFYTA
jgi:catechol 2,3-dioxygenase-like lactoylglutathione lyase family enzyme